MFAIEIPDARHNLFCVVVIPNAPRDLDEMIQISGAADHPMHLDRASANDIEYQV